MRSEERRFHQGAGAITPDTTPDIRTHLIQSLLSSHLLLLRAAGPYTIYGAALIRIGAVEEGQEVLSTVDVRSFPLALLYRSYGLVARWDYAATLPVLKELIGIPGISEYWRRVARANYAAALVHERQFDEAEALLSALLAETKAQGNFFLHGQMLQHAAENSFWRKDWQGVERNLQSARTVLKDSDDMMFFVRKWEAFYEAYRRGLTRATSGGIVTVKKEAMKRRHWETVRECDRFQAVLSGNQRLFLHLYFGTPYAGYRKQLIADFERPVTLPSHYLWPKTGKRTLDLETARLNDREDLKAGFLVHRLLLCLASDFYRRFPLASIHFAVFPDSRFNPQTSPGKARQAIHRLRDWFSSRRFDAEVRREKAEFWLAPGDDAAFRIPLSSTTPSTDKSQFSLRRLREAYSGHEFSREQAERCLSISRATSGRLLAVACREGKLEKIRRGRNIRYRFRA